MTIILSSIVAFVGGLISLISPCSVMVIPTFIASLHNTTQSKSKTLTLFAAGVWLSLVPLAAGAIAINNIYSQAREPFTKIVGMLLMATAIGLLIGKHIPLPNLTTKFTSTKRRSSAAKVFILGIVAGIGATTCVGPILGTILTLSATQTNPATAVLLVTLYALGIMLPIIVGSVVFDKSFGSFIKRIRDNAIYTPLGSFNVYNTLAAILVFVVGWVFYRYQGTLSINSIPGLNQLMLSGFDFQDTLLNSIR